jgi:hypothetical protein
MIEDDLNSSSCGEEDSEWGLASSAMPDTHHDTPRGSMRGLQVATAEGWLIQRARDMCSFAHDRYRQAAQAEAELLPREIVAKMSFKVSSFAYVLSFDALR